MFASGIDDEQLNEQDDEKDIVAQALNFYKKALLYYPQTGSIVEDTKEFIFVNSY